jgi:hypothetical protein
MLKKIILEYFMKREHTITIIVLLIALISALASACGIISDDGPGMFTYESIRGQTIEIYGRGVYRHMSADVAVQGIAQDYVTLFVAIPLLMLSLIGYRKRSLRAHFLMAGILGYFLVTYLFYMTMGMYNRLFMAYVALLGLTFFGFFLTVKELSRFMTPGIFPKNTPNRFVGGFLIFNALAIALLWLGVIIPPIADGTIYPAELHHYTTLIVQGFDLGLLLPICLITGIMLLRGKPEGYLYGTVYVGFLSLLMTALTAKIIAMAIHQVNVIPVIFIIPTINIITIISAFLMIRSVKREE